MNIEAFEGCKTVEEAVEVSQQTRRQRFILYVDLRAEGVRADLLRHLPEDEQHKFYNQIGNAINDRAGIPERLCRRLEWIVGLPFGWFDQPFPQNELRASRARAIRLKRKIDTYGLDVRFAQSSKLKIAQSEGAVRGERGISKNLYQQMLTGLRTKPRA